MKYDLKAIIEKELKKYRIKSININEKSYNLYVFLEDEDINLFDGFLFVETDDKKETDLLIDKYRLLSTSYDIRLVFLLSKDKLWIKDYRANKYVVKTLEKVNKGFIKKIKNSISEPSEENLKKMFDRSDIIEEFYILYKKSRTYIIKNLKGISEEEKREEFTDNLMMEMLTLWYLQEKGFLNNDKLYFITKFNELYQKSFNGFNNYFEFLNYLFDKISGHYDYYITDDFIGKCIVIGPAVFLNAKSSYESVSIPDKVFYQKDITEKLIDITPKGHRRKLKESDISFEIPLLNLFESRDWTDGNIDEYVLGAIYEKLITADLRKQTGAYYTPEDITSYICKNTIEPFLIDNINTNFDVEIKSMEDLFEKADKKLLLFTFENLRDIKILDLSVGSAHFLESAINVLLSVYENIWGTLKELGAKNGLKIITTDEKGNINSLELLEISNREKFRLYVKFFIILSKNVYGVDINPNALKVAKSRLFLTLAKHFDSKKEYFIRFPNVHFNLREGNSLLGYSNKEIERMKNETITLDFFKDYETSFVTDPIRDFSYLNDYLIQMSNLLELNGNLINEIDALNTILSKKKIVWADFNNFIRIREKLVQILIVSLNSEYAKSINNLLNHITELFNEKLDEKFSKDYRINLNKLKKLKTFHWIFEFPEVFLDKGGFDIIVGNPPYGGKVDDAESKLNDKCNMSKPNLAKLFVLRSHEMVKDDCYMALLTPKSLTYASDWLPLRNFLLEELLEIYDVKEAFKDVLLEQIFFILKKQSKRDYYLAKDFFSDETPIKIFKDHIEDTLLCDLSNEDFETIFSIKKRYSLTDLIHTYRGLPFQKYINNDGNEPVIAGKNIEPYNLKGDISKIDEKQLPNYSNGKKIEELKNPKIVFQNIVAFITKPVPHIKVMGTKDHEGYLAFDTVNVIETNNHDPLLFLGIMNSVFFSWILHRISFNKAIRTMHLDNYALSKVPMPDLNENISKEIIKDVLELLKSEFSMEKYLSLEEKVLSLFSLSINQMPEDYQILINWKKKG